MSYGYGGWAPYVSVAERRKRAQREVAKLRKQGQAVNPVIIQGNAIATSFWGKAWCRNLESYRDYESRLPRGRSYLRHGSVLDLQIAPHTVKALVSGSSVYKIAITITPVPLKQWRSICDDCAGGVASLLELLQGRLSKQVMERICRQEQGLFPRPQDIKFSCSCPDFASMCKHVAAVLYGVGARLDQAPELLFRLRGVEGKDLLAHFDAATPLFAHQAPPAERLLDAGDVAALFGITIATVDYPVTQQRRRVRKVAAT